MAALLEATRPALKDVLGKVYSMSRDQVCLLFEKSLTGQGGSVRAPLPVKKRICVSSAVSPVYFLPRVDCFASCIFCKSLIIANVAALFVPKLCSVVYNTRTTICI